MSGPGSVAGAALAASPARRTTASVLEGERPDGMVSERATVRSIPAGDVDAVVSRGGRVDVAEGALTDVAAPTLLVVGGDDREVLEPNEAAHDRLRCEKDLHVVPGAGHRLEGPGELEEVADVAGQWFETHLA